MKTLFKILTLAVLLSAFSALAFAQDMDLETAYNKYREEKKKPCGQRGEAVKIGKYIAEKFKDEVDNKKIVDFVKDDFPKIEKLDARCNLEKRYNDAYTGKKWAEFLTASKEIMAVEGDTNLGIDLLLTHVSTVYDRVAVDKDASYNNDAVSLAKTALQKIDSGKTSQTGKWGVYAPFNTKADAQSWMNFIIADINYNKLSQKKEALPYYYKATQVGTEKKDDVSIYYNIGNYYFDEAAALDTKYREARKANNNEDNDETKKLLGLARGTADRGIDAFGRAYKIATAPTSKLTPEQKAAILKSLTDLYKFRFNIAADAKTPDLNTYVQSQISKPMPDPATEITPVVEEVKPATTTTTPTTTPTTTTTTTTTTTPKTPTTTTTTPKTTETTKTPVKKPVTKKKGTR